MVKHDHSEDRLGSGHNDYDCEQLVSVLRISLITKIVMTCNDDNQAYQDLDPKEHTSLTMYIRKS